MSILKPIEKDAKYEVDNQDLLQWMQENGYDYEVLSDYIHREQGGLWLQGNDQYLLWPGLEDLKWELDNDALTDHEGARLLVEVMERIHKEQGIPESEFVHVYWWW